MKSRLTLAGIALGTLMALAGASTAAANPYRDCDRRIERAEYKLDRAIDHHGYYSRQAEHARHELREAREGCRYNR